MCCICMEPFKSEQELEESLRDQNYQKIKQISECKHVFHQTCLKKWFQQNSLKLQCPVCKLIVDFTQSASSLAQSSQELWSKYCNSNDLSNKLLLFISRFPNSLFNSIFITRVRKWKYKWHIKFREFYENNLHAFIIQSTFVSQLIHYLNNIIDV